MCTRASSCGNLRWDRRGELHLFCLATHGFCALWGRHEHILRLNKSCLCACIKTGGGHSRGSGIQALAYGHSYETHMHTCRGRRMMKRIAFFPFYHVRSVPLLFLLLQIHIILCIDISRCCRQRHTDKPLNSNFAAAKPPQQAHGVLRV